MSYNRAHGDPQHAHSGTLVSRRSTNAATKDKDGEELDQVAGNAEDEIGERIAAVRENEMLSVQSLLGTFGALVVQIAGSPHKFKVCTCCSPSTIPN